MADKYGAAAVNGLHKSDVESSAAANSEEIRRKKRMKYLTYGIAFVVFQTIVIVIFSLTIMKVKGPKFRVRSASVENFSVGSSNSPSFNGSFNCQFGVKNTNFGQYKYDSTIVTFAYRGTNVGEAIVSKSKANMLSTKKINLSTELSLPSTTSSEWSNDLNSGILPLTATSSRLNGKVTLMFIMKKKKSTQMNCTMDLVTATQSIQNIKCK